MVGKRHPKNDRAVTYYTIIGCKTIYLEKFGAHREHKLVRLEEGPAGRDDNICQERTVAELLCIREENRMVVVPL